MSDTLTFDSPAITATFTYTDCRYTITREGKGDHFSFSYPQLIKYGWAPLTGTSLNGQVTLWWDWSNDLAWSVDRLGRTTELKGLSATVEDLAFLYLS